MKYPTMRFVFDRKKVATKTHKGLVQIEVLSEGKRKWIGTGVKVYSDQWNDRKKIINSVEMIQLNQCLDEQLRIIQNWINELISKKEVFDFDKLDRFLRYTNKSESFVDFVERRIEERGDITESTKASHRTFATSLREFDRIIYFSDLTKANITLYDDWLHAKGYSQPTIYNYHKRNKRYIHEAIKFDLLKNDPYKGERFSRGKHAIRKYLTAEELKKVKDAQIDSETICRVRDLFIFQAYTGISYADLAKFNFKRDVWKIQCKLPPKTKRFCPLKTFNNAPLKSLDRWGYYYFSLFPSVCSHFTDTFSCQLNPVRRMYNTIHNGICYCRVSDCIIPIVRWQLRGDDDGLAPMSVLYYIEQDGSFLGIKVHKEEVIQYEQRAPFDSLEFRFQCAFYFCHLKRTHKFRSIRIICPYALLAGFIPHCCGKEALPGTG